MRRQKVGSGSLVREMSNLELSVLKVRVRENKVEKQFQKVGDDLMRMGDRVWKLARKFGTHKLGSGAPLRKLSNSELSELELGVGESRVWKSSEKVRLDLTRVRGRVWKLGRMERSLKVLSGAWQRELTNLELAENKVQKYFEQLRDDLTRVRGKVDKVVRDLGAPLRKLSNFKLSEMKLRVADK